MHPSVVPMQISSVSQTSGKATVMMGNLPVEVKLSDLAPWTDTQSGSKPRQKLARHSAPKKGSANRNTITEIPTSGLRLRSAQAATFLSTLA